MSLQRRLFLYLLICAPLVWAVALTASVNRARHEVNELFDTEMVRLARQALATLHMSQDDAGGESPAFLSRVGAAAPASSPVPGAAAAAEGSKGDADVRDLAIAVWDASGQLLAADREGAQLRRIADATGFVDEPLAGSDWRVYYLRSANGQWLVAAGQRMHERDEVVVGLTASQVLPWLLVLPALLIAMAWAVRRALAPLHLLTEELGARDAGDLKPVPEDHAPVELKPLLAAMNGLFVRIGDALGRERRFTADAAHELRTPLAVLRAQWDVVRRASGAERAQAEAKLGAGFDRVDRLVTQMLALSHLEAVLASGATLPAMSGQVAWPPIVEEAISDCLALAERRRIDLECEWPPDGQAAFMIRGDTHLLTVLLRNLLDNAVRYAPPGSGVALRFADDRLEVENDGDALDAGQIARIGERFHRLEGQQESGSGLGVSIVQRIAAMHGLEVVFGSRADGQGVRVTLRARPGLRSGSGSR